ncbi:methenyltetrahydrofolate synthase domain-containing protein [Orussus abietinus]|uniref:methenyltetrahydrofolate synthase domain-containing protein n=1 Tax=Orussus abietinus TaxID=222816 RepID=UPI0006255D62|nr:methenyltetrahydrofolate synthase domain-containing protein [Orussus abietinus]
MDCRLFVGVDEDPASSTNKMTEEVLPEEVTKHSFRQKIWDYMTQNQLANFPLTLYRRIPNFKGAAEAAQRLSELEEFGKAKTIKINPDKPQEPVRFLALEANKEILVPIPRLKTGLFLHIVPVAGATKEQLKTAASRHGLKKWGTPLGISSNIKVDMIVLGSVCVSKSGHRIGKGEGFADLEFAMLMRMGAVTEETIVVTTVHDCQIIDDLPTNLFKDYDVPVDIIVTPTQSIFVNPRLKRPTGIIWGILSRRRLESMPILQQLKEEEEKEGKVIVLKEIDSDVEIRQYEKHKMKKLKYKKRPKKRTTSGTEDGAGEGEKDKEVKPRTSKRRQAPKRQEGDSSPTNEEKTEENGKEKPLRRKIFKPRNRLQIDFSLKLSNIASDVRVRDLKNALLQRGVKPNDITWRGSSGFCYLHFGKLKNENSSPDQPVQIDSVLENLQCFRIGDSLVANENDFIVVERAKPITRIEVTDVSAV